MLVFCYFLLTTKISPFFAKSLYPVYTRVKNNCYLCKQRKQRAKENGTQKELPSRQYLYNQHRQHRQSKVGGKGVERWPREPVFGFLFGL